ncbi:MAG: metal-dependent hydrolase [Blastocatellia bacterium]|nr:metal-dependent hydrolase [Blastocatellia bacterium]
MENLAHTLFGATVYKGHFEKYAPNTLALWVIGANLPDFDIVSRAWGSAAYLCQHRGLTHSILGILLLSLLLASLWWVLQKVLKRESKWSILFVSSLVSLSTHPLLDFLNNYGIRPFLPFSKRWFYGDLVFIVDPWIWLILGGALFLSSKSETKSWLLYLLCSLITSVVVLGVGSVPLASKALWVIATAGLIFWRVKAGVMSTKVCRTAIIFLLVYISMLYFLQQAATYAAKDYAKSGAVEEVTKFSVSASPANPFRWEVFAESQNFFYYGAIRLYREPSAEVTLARRRVYRNHPAVQKAFLTDDGKAILDFGRYLLADVETDPNGYSVILGDGRYSRGGRSFSTFVIKIPRSEIEVK